VAVSAITVCGAQGGIDFLGCGADAGEKLLMESFGRPDERRLDRERCHDPGAVSYRGRGRPHANVDLLLAHGPASLCGDNDLLSVGREDLLRRTTDGWQLARRTILVDDSVLRTQNLAIFL
jgi:Ring hydroxylating beta subunit